MTSEFVPEDTHSRRRARSHNSTNSGARAIPQWQAMGEPRRWRLVEMGPGNGTLMSDLLRGTAVNNGEASSAFRKFRESLEEVCLVEVSPTMVRKQAEKLGGDMEELGRQLDGDAGTDPPAKAKETGTASEDDVIRLSSNGLRLSWHKSLSSVPQDVPEVVILHELMDALPVHQFVRVGAIDEVSSADGEGARVPFDKMNKDSWRERLVDIADEHESVSPYHFRFVISPRPTLASATILDRRLQLMDAAEAGGADSIEVCPRAIALAQELAGRASATGGASLIIDYGSDEHSDASLRAIRKHRLVHPLSTPGRSDLSCGVDFSALRQAVLALRATAGTKSTAHGPVSQSHFLHEMGIVPRMEQLGRNAATDADRDEIMRAYVRLVGTGESRSAESDPQGGEEGDSDAGRAGLESQHSKREEGMGQSYMCLAITADTIGRPHAF